MGLRFHDRASPEATACSRTVPGDAPETPGLAVSPRVTLCLVPGTFGAAQAQARPPARLWVCSTRFPPSLRS